MYYTICYLFERDTRIELASLPWEGNVLPLYESRMTNSYKYIVTKIKRSYVSLLEKSILEVAILCVTIVKKFLRR